MSRRIAAISLTSAFVVALLSIAGPVRAAVPASPSGLTPDGVASSGIPVLSWNRVSGATSYDVVVARPGAFDSPLWSGQTVNRRAVPPVQLPGGSIDWRVRARGADGTSGWAQASFTKNAHSAPTPQSPASGAILDPPSQPTLLSWTPVSGAVSYTIQVGTDSNFVDSALFKTYTTKTSSYVVPDPLVATQYFWRVQANVGSGIVTDWSEPSDYQIGGLAKPVLLAPLDAPTTSVKDVVLDWQPVLGAKTYNLQISTDQNFNTLVGGTRTGITGTRYSPPTTLANDQYYWRVTPVDAAGNKLDWLDVDSWTFRRHWPDQPNLEFPEHQAIVGDPFYYQWTPVPLASSYEIHLSSTADFATFAKCPTTNTTYVPTNGDDPCQPDALGTYYWRVIAIDAPGRTTDNDDIVTDRIVAEVRRFTYDPARVDLVSPADGASVEIPTLSWDPVAGSAQYKVTITATDGGSGGGTFVTAATSFTPRTKLSVGKTYRWKVQTMTESEREGASLLAGSQPTFTVVASTATTGATPEPTSPPTETTRFPTLAWAPVTGATYYRVLLREAGTLGGWVALSETFGYAEGQDRYTSWLSPATYEWMVEAYNNSGAISQSATRGAFTIEHPTEAIGESLAMSGLALENDATSCAKALDPAEPLADQQCVDLRATPVLSWDPDPEAGYYKVWLARDQQMTNIVSGYPVHVESTRYTPRSTLIDSQAGSAFYWFVQPCKVGLKCAPIQHAQHAFNKLSKPVETLSPDVGDVQANDITFTWRDYLATNQDATTPAAGGVHTGVYSVEPDVEAKQYRIQVDSDPNFQEPLLETAVVDQTTFTSFGSTYPEGPLYWRVQAIDGSNNSLTWSDPVSFTKTSPTVSLVTPVGNQQVSGAAPLRWSPLAFAASYDVEVYKANDTVGSSGNRVVSGNSKQVAFSLAVPLEVSDVSYTWRVRPVDALGRKGPWTDLAATSAKFRVVGQAPSLTQPVAEAIVAGNDALFAWQGVDGAANYRFERRLVGGTSIAETRTTPATAWAPQSAIPNGSWEWRVSSLDSNGKVIRASAWRSFRVDSTSPVVSAATPRTSALRTANFVATLSEPVKGVSSGTYRIYRSGSTNALTATVTLNSTRTKATLNPATNLKVGVTYVIKLSSKILDDAGNKLTAYSWKVKAK